MLRLRVAMPRNPARRKIMNEFSFEFFSPCRRKIEVQIRKKAIIC